MLSLIVAVDKKGAIGEKGDIPWSLPEDQKRFKELTMGHSMIMGRKTFESLPGILPGRKHYVASSKPLAREHKRLFRIDDLEAFLSDCMQSSEEYFVIGGAQIYRQALPYADNIYLTQIDQTFENADTFFPKIDQDCFTVCDTSGMLKDEDSGLIYEFIQYTRK